MTTEKSALTSATIPGTARGAGGTSVPDAAQHFNVSARHFWRLISAGRIKTIRFGARVPIPDAEMRRLEREGAK